MTSFRQAYAKIRATVASPAVRSRVAKRVGAQVLADVRQAYVTKSTGGVGEDGIKWKPLAESTLARRRPGRKKVGLTVRAAEKVRRATYRESLAAGTSPAKAREAAGKARRAAERTSKRMPSRAGNEILIVTGALLASLRVREGSEGEIVVDSPLPYFTTHQNGRGGIPARPIFPKRIPREWRERWLLFARVEMAEELRRALK